MARHRSTPNVTGVRLTFNVITAAMVAVITVLELAAALVIVLLVGIAVGVVLLRRALELDRSFSEILSKQNQQRYLLTVGRRHPGPPPIRG